MPGLVESIGKITAAQSATTVGMSRVTLLLLLVLDVSINFVSSAKVLLAPVNINSHIIMFSRLAVGLTDHGHSTSMLAASSASLPQWLQGKVEILTYQLGQEVPHAHSEAINQLMVKMAAAESFWERMTVLQEVDLAFYAGANKDCEHVMNDRALVDKTGKADYDLAIMDMSNLFYLYNLPYKLDIPYAHFSISYLSWAYGVPGLPSFTPNYVLWYSDSMSSTERLKNALMETWTCLILVLNDSAKYGKRYVPEKPPMTVLRFIVANGSLYFYLRDLSLGYPSPLMPNTVEIGDIMVLPAKPLPSSLKKYMDESTEGVVLISLGSFLAHMPTDIALKLSSVRRFGRSKPKLLENQEGSR